MDWIDLEKEWPLPGTVVDVLLVDKYGSSHIAYNVFYTQIDYRAANFMKEVKWRYHIPTEEERGC